ncbi:MAG TPA: hypothetical protein HA222_00690 [Candidatus Diapherotrites archaeon]|uniref:Peptidase M11 gametolysin domain-containing protein n=2 Tax=Candidatus Iainarchaeum sp. TaxID=3101447 RepID=A0A7J4K0Y5_9ARCH|nr:hypothetical protein [Candidatus Diapherotrites archaeon]
MEEEPQAVCGNGIVETGEQCDGTDLAGQTCQSQGFVGGTLGCNSECAAFDVSQCIQLDSLGVQKTLILPVDFLDSGPRPFTKEKIYDLILAEESPFQNFFKENSYGKLSFSGAVADWYQIQRSKTYCGISIGGDSDNSLSKIITESNIVELAQYSRILVLGNCYGTAFGSVGKESLSLGGKTYQMSYSFVPGVAYLNENSVNNEFIWNSYYKTLAHEVGHNLGAGHANGWDCDDQVLRGNCTHLDLQNSFDTMGYGLYNSTHFNAFYKELFEWIDEDEILTITQTGNYTINPLEAAGSAIKLAKIQIQKTKETPFYIEFRKGIGYDSGLNKPGWAINQEGLMINNIVKENQPYPMTRLLDMSPHPGISYPGEGHWFTDSGSGGATLNKGQSFNDSEDGFQITTIDNNPSQIIFNVTFTQS